MSPPLSVKHESRSGEAVVHTDIDVGGVRVGICVRVGIAVGVLVGISVLVAVAIVTTTIAVTNRLLRANWRLGTNRLLGLAGRLRVAVVTIVTMRRLRSTVRRLRHTRGRLWGSTTSLRQTCENQHGSHDVEQLHLSTPLKRTKVSNFLLTPRRRSPRRDLRRHHPLATRRRCD